MSEHVEHKASDRLQVTVVTPDGEAFVGHATSVVIPAHDGEVDFLCRHAPFVGIVGIGELRIRTAEGTLRRWYLEGGVAQTLHNEVTVLAERVVPVEEVDVAAARQDLAEALATVPTTDEAFAERDRKLVTARVRLRLAGELHGA